MTYQDAAPNDTLEPHSLLTDIASRHTITLAAESSVGEAAGTMAKQCISSVVVTDDSSRPVGIVTERNVLRAMQTHCPRSTSLRDVMSSPVITVPPTITLLDAYRLCQRHKIRHLVIVDKEGLPTGVVSETDFRLHLNFTALAGRRKVVSVAKRSTLVLPPGISLEQTLELMLNQRKSCVVVTEGGKPVGIVTERDVVRFYSSDKQYSDITLGEVMVSPVLTVQNDISINQAADVMFARKIRHLVVVNGAGLMDGLVSEHDLAQAMVTGMSDERDGVEENFLRTLINTLPDLFWLKDTEGRFLACNPRFEQFCGAKEAEIIGKTDYDLVDRKLADLFRERDRKAMAAEKPCVTEEWVPCAHDGRHKLLETVKTPLYDQRGNLIGVLAIARDIGQRRRTEEALATSETRYRSLVENSPFCIHEIDLERRLQSVNQAGLRMLELEDDTQVVGMPFLEHISEQDRERIELLLQRAFKGESTHFEYLSSGEKPLHFKSCFIPIRDSGGAVTRLMGIAEDVTKRKQAEQALRESEGRLRQSEELLRSLIEAIPDAVQFKDARGRWLEANLSARQTFGLENCDCRGKTDEELAEIAAPRYRAPLRQCHATDEATWQRGGLTRVEEAVPLPEGNEMTFDVIKKPLFTEEGRRKALVIVGRDVTELKQTEDALRHSLEAYSELVRRIPVGVFKLRMKANGGVLFDYVSPRWSEMNELDEDDTRDNAEMALAAIRLEDQESFLRLFDEAADTLTWEGRARKKNGDLRWLHIEAQATRLKNGDILWDGIQYDITARRTAEDALRVTASVFDTSQEAILITDAENRITEVNPAFTRITGYHRDEVLGQNPSLLSSGHHSRNFYAKLWRSLQRDKAWRGEIWNRRKSGEIYAELLSISVIYDGENEVQRYVAVFSDISHIKAHEAELSRVAHYDALTGIPNRVLLADRMKQALAQTAREENMMAVCYLDLDGFKPVNDALGHEAGDEVLVEIARRIERTIRGGDTVARLGGDEFVVLLLNIGKRKECTATLNRLLEAIAQPIVVKKRSQLLSASIGVSIYPQDDEDPDTLLRHADQAMYLAKQAGKNRYHIYDPALDKRARIHHELLASIRQGLEQNQFELHYQPKINLRTRELVGVEALIRWRHPEHGLLPPAEFLRPAEGTELDIEIGEWVIRNTLEQLEQWYTAGLVTEVGINISAHHLESPQFAKKLRRQVERFPNIGAGSLQIEVLETAALEDTLIVRDVIDECHQFGVRFALDDFGTGYSSLSYLSSLPVDVLKIDQSFVRDMLEDMGDMAIVQGVVALARAFGRGTVAEGIETEEHYQTLLDIGCEIGQGFGIAYPMPADNLIAWMKG